MNNRWIVRLNRTQIGVWVVEQAVEHGDDGEESLVAWTEFGGEHAERWARAAYRFAWDRDGYEVMAEMARRAGPTPSLIPDDYNWSDSGVTIASVTTAWEDTD